MTTTLFLAALAAGPAGEIDVRRDVPYLDGGGDRHKLDLYLPKEAKNAPVLLYFHGGGFSKGDRAEAANVGEALARHGVIVASAGYRLTPPARHPDHARDAAAAFVWLRRNAGTFGGDGGSLFVGGHSAGAILASIVGTNDLHLKQAGAELADVRGVVALSAMYELDDTRAAAFGDYKSRKLASPSTHVRAGLPPFFVAYADDDGPGRADSAKGFAAALKGVGVEAVLYEAKGRDHGSIAKKMADGDPTASAALDFIRRHARK